MNIGVGRACRPFSMLFSGIVIVMATKAVFKPLSYLTACTILSTDKETLRQQENDVKNKKKLAVELFYKV